MKPSEVVEAMKHAHAAGLAIGLSGQPGVGKTALCRAFAESIGGQFWPLTVPLHDPTDLKGMPWPDREHGVTHFLPMATLPLEPDAKGVLLLDEITAAPPLMQAGCYRLALERVAGDKTISKDVVIVCAGNRAEDKGSYHKLAPALSSRFVWLDVEPDLEDWCAWAVQNGVLPEVLAFVRFKPEALVDYKPEDRSFACPRSLADASKLLATKPSGGIRHALLKGKIGPGRAAEFEGFLRSWESMPDIDDIIARPAKAKVPPESEPATRYAVVTALAYRMDKANCEAVLSYWERLPQEFMVAGVAMAVKREPGLCSVAAWKTWAAKHGKALAL